MNTQLSDLDFWSEDLYKKHRDLVADKLGDKYSSWKHILPSYFRYYSYMRYASYYAVVFSNQYMLLSPVMGVSDQTGNKRRGYVCIHPFGVDHALNLIGKIVSGFIDNREVVTSLFDDSEIIRHLDSFMSKFLFERFVEKDPDSEDEKIDSLFYYGSWLTEIDFDSDGGYLTKECELCWEYRVPAGTFEYSCEEVFGFIVMPRIELFKLLEEQGLVIS